MSVEIYDVENGEEPGRICIPVASELRFCTTWEAALQQLGIRRLGNGVWLYREELASILADFQRVRDWAGQNLPLREADAVVRKVDYIVRELPERWREEIPRLWMG